MKTPLFEVCIASLEDALSCVAGGAGRVELNSALEVGGLTPSAGLVREVVDALQPKGIPVVTMVRPRPGGFCYGDADLRVMRRDIEALLEAGVDGVALGVLAADGGVDAARCAELIAPVLDAGKEAVFHRAFDLTPDPFAAIDSLIDLGFKRVLTSGQAASAPAGTAMLAKLVNHAAGRIEVLPGGGVRPSNAAKLLADTGCTQLHGSLRTTHYDTSTQHQPALRFGVETLPPESQYGTTDGTMVAAVVAAMHQAMHE